MNRDLKRVLWFFAIWSVLGIAARIWLYRTEIYLEHLPSARENDRPMLELTQVWRLVFYAGFWAATLWLFARRKAARQAG